MKRQPNLSLAVVGKTYGNPTSGWMDEQLAAPGQTDFVVTEVSHAVRAMPPNKDKTVQIRSAVSMITTTRSQFSRPGTAFTTGGRNEWLSSLAHFWLAISAD